MSLFNTLGIGASGLSANSVSLSVIGDNIANLGTTAFKSTRATFEDVLPGLVVGSEGSQRLGTGVALSSVDLDNSQGAMRGTGMALDVAVFGTGMFQLTDGQERFFTRDGSFRLDSGGNLVNSSGLRVQGYLATDGVLTTAVGDLTVKTDSIAQRATTTVTLNAALAADLAASPADYAALPAKDGSAAAPTLADCTTAADYSTSVTVYDSLGRAHTVSLVYEATGSNTYSWAAIVDAGETDIAGAVSGRAFEIASGVATFDTDGQLTGPPTNVPSGTAWTWPGAAAFTLNLDAGGGAGLSGRLVIAGSEASTTNIGQDGWGVGSLASISVEKNGVIVGSYTNGQDQALGQIALATFPAQDALLRVGGNLFRATLSSGEPALGAPGDGRRGDTIGGSLEASNVDLEVQFVALIEAQRSYQANTSVIKSADQTLQQLVSLV
jgi:flagellar hook protein FlgE